MNTEYNGHSQSSGVYQIRNNVNGRVYIGSAKRFKQRYSEHCKTLEKGTHHNKYLQNDWNKCGSDAFTFEVLEVVEGDQSNRLMVEQTKLDSLYDNQDSCYNFKKQAKADSRSCFSKTPEETSKKLSHARKLQWENKDYRERITKILQQHSTKKGDVLSEATKQKIRDARKNQMNHKPTISVVQLDKDMNIVNVYASTKAAVTESGIANVVYACQGKRKTAGNYYWMYYEQFVKSNCDDRKELHSSLHKNSKKVMKLSLEGTEICTYDSITEACKANKNVHRSSINKVVKGILNHAGGFKWSYVENE